METRFAIFFSSFFADSFSAITLWNHKLLSPPIILVIITKTESYQQTLNFRRHFLLLFIHPPIVLDLIIILSL